MSLNMKAVVGFAVLALGVYVVAPGLAYAVVPLLILAACPLSMVLMMKMMSRSKTNNGSVNSATQPGPAEGSDKVADSHGGEPPPRRGRQPSVDSSSGVRHT